MLPKYYAVMTRNEYQLRELKWSITATPVGIVFGAGLIVGLVIGVIICYQILFNLINDHLSQFATLKAIGYSVKDLFGVVINKSLILCTLSFVPGFFCSLVVYDFIQGKTGIVMSLSIARISVVLILTFAMSLISAMIAIKELAKADPADLF